MNADLKKHLKIILENVQTEIRNERKAHLILSVADPQYVQDPTSLNRLQQTLKATADAILIAELLDAPADPDRPN